MEAFIAISISLMAGEPSKTYKNPVVNYSLPDPTVIEAEDGYFYLYATEDIILAPRINKPASSYPGSPLLL